MEIVTRLAVNALVESANTPTAFGGRMRVDTGFLRNSIAANVGAMPSGESQRPAGATDGSIRYTEGEAIELAIMRWKPPEGALFVGWTANYAPWREVKDGFVEAAVQRWDVFVSEAVAEAKRELP